MNRDFDIIVTKNPESMTAKELVRAADFGATLIRINGSFLQAEGVGPMVSAVRDACGDRVGILLDLPGFKPRFTHLQDSIRYEAGEPMRVPMDSINYPDIITHMAPGDVIRINDGMVRLTIDSLANGDVVFIPDRPGKLRRGKGFYLEKRGYRPEDHCLSPLDKELIELAKGAGIDYVGVSFVHDMHDLEYVADLLRGSGTGYIPKIEARASLQEENLLPMLAHCDRVIIDRGDLSGEMGLDAVWGQQRKVLDLAKLNGCRVIMATQFLTSMMDKPLPSIAEVDSLCDLLDFGIDGVQLSEETCVGSHGPEVLRLVTESRQRILRERRERERPGGVVWIMGPTSSGKTSTAQALTRRLEGSKIQAVHYDGDEVRNLFGPDFGFEGSARLAVVRTLAHLAAKAAAMGQNVVVSALTANPDARALVREMLPDAVVVHLDCPIDVCAERDPKGLYAKAKAGEITTLVGYNTPYLPPENPDLTVDTSSCAVEDTVGRIVEYLLRKGRIRTWA